MKLVGIRHDDGRCTFYGQEISPEGVARNKVDYGTLAKCFDSVLNNYVHRETYDVGYWEQVSGFVDNSEEIDDLKEQIEEKQERIEELETSDELYDENERIVKEISTLKDDIDDLEAQIEELEEEQDGYYDEIFQEYIVDARGAEILEEANEILYYNDALDMYLWGITHYGTSWNYVMTDIPIITADEFYKSI